MLVSVPQVITGTHLQKQSQLLVMAGNMPERVLIDRVTAVVHSVSVFRTDVLHVLL